MNKLNLDIIRHIAVDFDDVLFPCVGHMTDFLRLQGYPHLRAENITVFHLHEIMGCSPQRALEIELAYHQLGTPKETVLPIANSQEIIQLLKQRYRRLSVATSRRSNYGQSNIDYANHYYPKAFSDFYFGDQYGETNHTPKSSICVPENVDLIIDDNLDHAIDCAKAGVQVILFGDYGWNKTPSGGLPEGVFRASDWKKVGQLLLPEQF